MTTVEGYRLFLSPPTWIDDGTENEKVCGDIVRPHARSEALRQGLWGAQRESLLACLCRSPGSLSPPFELLLKHYSDKVLPTSKKRGRRRSMLVRCGAKSGDDAVELSFQLTRTIEWSRNPNLWITRVCPS